MCWLNTYSITNNKRKFGLKRNYSDIHLGLNNFIKTWSCDVTVQVGGGNFRFPAAEGRVWEKSRNPEFRSGLASGFEVDLEAPELDSAEESFLTMLSSSNWLDPESKPVSIRFCLDRFLHLRPFPVLSFLLTRSSTICSSKRLFKTICKQKKTSFKFNFNNDVMFLRMVKS